MRRHITHLLAAVAAAVTLSTLGVTGASASGAAPAPRPAAVFSGGTSQAAAVPGTQLWVKRYNGPGNGYDSASGVAVSPDGRTVFVTGASPGKSSSYDYTTIAYSTVTGAQLWLKRYNGPANAGDWARSVAVSPDGRMVFVTGSSTGGTATGIDYATVAYSAATGAQLWVSRYNGPENGSDGASSMAVSPGGDRVFVTGNIKQGDEYDYATVAYRASTGAQLWVKRYNGPGNGYDVARSVAVSPGGGTVFVTGLVTRQKMPEDLGIDYGTIAYSAATGAQLWVKLYNGPINNTDEAYSMAVSPSGSTVFVTGESPGKTGQTLSYDYATVAYNAATGARLWVSRYNGPANGYDAARSVAVSPGGSTVFVTGSGTGKTTGVDFATVAYNAGTGAQLWAKRYNGPGNDWDWAQSVAVSPSGNAVFVTGRSPGTTSGEDYATVAYSAATGTQQWVRRYNGPGNSDDVASSVAVSPTGGRVFVTGFSPGVNSADYATIAYSG